MIVRLLSVLVCGFMVWGTVPVVAQTGEAGSGEDPEQPGMSYPALGHPAPTRVMFQSLILPGWGQVENHSYFKALLFLGAYAGFIQWGIRVNEDKQDADGRLARALEEERPDLELEVNRLADSRNAKYYFAGLTAVLAMADAFVDAHLKGFDERMDSDIAMTEDGIQVGLRWSFGGDSR